MSSQPSPLSDMIKNASVGIEKLAARARDPKTGTSASTGYLHKIVKGQLDRMPDEGHVAAIAIALRMPHEVVWLAAVIQWLPDRNGRIRNQIQDTLQALIKSPDYQPTIEASGATGEEIERAMRVIAEANRILNENQRPQAA